MSLRNTLLVLTMTFGASAFADTMVYTYTGTGSGSVGSTNFSGAAITISQTVDTANQVFITISSFAIDATSAQISIAGVGTFDFVTATRTFFWPGTGLIGFSRTDSEGGYDLYNSVNGVPSLVGWDMATPIGPVSYGFAFKQWDLLPVQTSGGVITLDAAQVAGTFQAVRVATAVPEPAELSIRLLSITSFLACRKRRR